MVHRHILRSDNIDRVIPVIGRNDLEMIKPDVPGCMSGASPVAAFHDGDALYQHMLAPVDLNRTVLSLYVPAVIQYPTPHDPDVLSPIGHEMSPDNGSSFNVYRLITADFDFTGIMDLTGFEKNDILVVFPRYVIFRRIGKDEQRPFDIFVDLDAQVFRLVQRKMDRIPVLRGLNISAEGTNIVFHERGKEFYLDVHFPFK